MSAPANARVPGSAAAEVGRRKAATAAALRRFYPRHFGRYIEPFFGSGAVFFDLPRPADSTAWGRAHRLQRRSDRLLRNRARCARRGGARSIGWPTAHARAGGALLRGARRRFNPQRDQRRGRRGRIDYTPALAAMLIYLNRTGFNGLFRRQRARRVQRAGRALRSAADCRSRASCARVADALSRRACRLVLRIVRAGARDRRSPATSSTSIRPTRRSADGELHRLHPPRFGTTISAAAAARDRAGAARLPRAAQQLDGPVEIAALYDGDADAPAAGLRALRVPARRAINSDRGAARRRRRVSDLQHQPACVPGGIAAAGADCGVSQPRRRVLG